MQNNAKIITDNMRFGLALLKSGYTTTSAAIKASVSEEELNYWLDQDKKGQIPKEVDQKKHKMN